MAYKTRYVKGDYNVWCSVCTGTMKRSQAIMRWDNVIVCEECWEPRHPQDHPARIPRDNIVVPDSSLVPTNTFTLTSKTWDTVTQNWEDITTVNWEDVGRYQ